PNTTQARGTVTVGTAGHLLRIRCMFPDPSLFGVRRGAERCSSDCHKPTFPGWGELSALSKSSLDPPRHRFQRLTDVPRLPRVVFCSCLSLLLGRIIGGWRRRPPGLCARGRGRRVLSDARRTPRAPGRALPHSSVSPPPSH